MQTSPPASAVVDGGLDGGELAEAFDAIADGDGAAAAAGVFATAAAGPGIAAISGGSGVEVDDGKSGVVVVNAARRSSLKLLDATVGGARGEGPEVAGVEVPGGAEGDGDPVFEDDGGAGSWDGDFARAAGGAEVGDEGGVVAGKTLPAWSQRRMRV